MCALHLRVPADVAVPFMALRAIIFVLASVAVGGWVVREPVLLGAANLWIVSDPVSRADAVVVLGGGLETRPFVAVELWPRGLADKILISKSPSEKIGVMTRRLQQVASA